MNAAGAEFEPSAGPAARAWDARAIWRWPRRRALIWAAAAVALFFVGRALAPHSIDFVVYHEAARSLLAGRTDLYSASFALEPPMRYVYPPLFVLVVAPLGLFPFADAFGLWFALLAVAAIASVRSALAAWWPRQGWTRHDWLMGLAALCLAGPAVIYGFRSANVHLLLVLMTLAAIVAWGQGRQRRAALLIAAAGAIKVFPLFLVPVLVALREWRLVTRIAVLSAGLWLLPFVWFGPARGLELYRQWERDVARNVERLRLESRLDVSLGSTAARWLSEVDYTQRIDPRYPQANLARLAPPQARAIGQGLVILVASLTLLAALKLGGSMADPTSRAAAAGSLFATAQLLIGPYTTLLYLSAWIVPALGLPAAAAIQLSVRRRLRAALGLLGAATLTLALLPGSASHRAVEAWGAHTLLTAALWALSLWLAWRFPRKRELSPA